MDLSIEQRLKYFEAQKKNLRDKLTHLGTMELMTEKRTLIVSTPPMIIVEQLQKGELSAVKVLEAFQAKALEVTERINCITEFIPEAEKWAAECDRADPACRGTLHGVPISVKECVNVKGCDTTIGLAKHLHNPVGDHAVLVKTMLAKGAVPFCRTNLPQTMLSYCCTNPVFGMTLHPEDPTRTPGGSSGGEGALIAAGGSILGIGTDLAGSARVPAAFTGCVGLKPTSHRLSGQGIKRALEGMVGNVSTAGLMGKDVSIVTYGMEALVGDDYQASLDVELVPVPWYPKRLEDTHQVTIGWYETFEKGLLPATPGLQRAVREARDALASCGHKVVPFNPPDMEWVLPTIVKIITADGGKEMSQHIEGEHIDPSVRLGLLSATWSPWRKRYAKYMIQGRSPMMASMLQDECCNSATLWEYLAKRRDYVRKFKKQMEDQGVDILLGPTFQYPAPQHHVPARTGPACLYSVLYNFIDFPAIAIPVSRENEDDQQRLNDYPEHDLQFKIVKEATRGATGLPLGVQLVAAPWQEEVLCRVAKELETQIVNLPPKEKDGGLQ